jgi:hypothetical protein
MRKSRILFLSGIFWELVRFSVFTLIIIGLLQETLISGTQKILWLMLIGAGQLLLPAAYFLLFMDQIKYYAYIQILRIGKMLSIFVSFSIIIYELLYNNIFLYAGSPQFYDKRYLLIVFLAIFFDLIFLYFLLSYKREDKNQKLGNLNNEVELPVYSETTIENNLKNKVEDR